MIKQVENCPEIKFHLRDSYPTDEIVVREIWVENVYEVDPSRLGRDTIVIDVGANIGSFSIYCAFYGSKVLAIEPEPNNITALERNVELNGFKDRIEIFKFGLSNFQGRAWITDEGGGSTIKDNRGKRIWRFLRRSKSDGVRLESIPVTTLDSLFEMNSLEKVDVLKMDVEGSEIDILTATSRENLQKCKYITIEFDIRVGHLLGEAVKKLSETHHVRTMGSWERGGMIFAWLY